MLAPDSGQADAMAGIPGAGLTVDKKKPTRKRASRRKTGPPTDFSPNTFLAEKARALYTTMDTPKPWIQRNFDPSQLKYLKTLGFKLEELGRWWAVGKALETARVGGAEGAAEARKERENERTSTNTKMIKKFGSVGLYAGIVDPKVVRRGVRARDFDSEFL